MYFDTPCARVAWLNKEASHVNGSDGCNAVIVSADGH